MQLTHSVSRRAAVAAAAAALWRFLHTDGCAFEEFRKHFPEAKLDPNSNFIARVK